MIVQSLGNIVDISCIAGWGMCGHVPGVRPPPETFRYERLR
jgi:hypothetical protein